MVWEKVYYIRYILKNVDDENMQAFICDCCGLCCMNISKSEIYSDLDRGDGVCKYFEEETKLCSIYSERPLKCNIDKMYEVYFKGTISKSEYYKLNYNACKKLKEEGKGLCI